MGMERSMKMLRTVRGIFIRVRSECILERCNRRSAVEAFVDAASRLDAELEDAPAELHRKCESDLWQIVPHAHERERTFCARARLCLCDCSVCDCVRGKERRLVCPATWTNEFVSERAKICFYIYCMSDCLFFQFQHYYPQDIKDLFLTINLNRTKNHAHKPISEPNHGFCEPMADSNNSDNYNLYYEAKKCKLSSELP